jgi:hypothetical protein
MISVSSFISNRRVAIKKIFCLFVIFVFLASCAPILVPQSESPTETLDAPKFQTPTLSVTGTFTATFTSTSFPPGFTPSPTPTTALVLPEQRCSEAPPEQNEFDLPAPSDLEWEMVNNLQSLTGLAGPIQSAYPSPDGRWWMIEMVSKRNYSQFDYSSQTALYVLDSKESQHWIASPDDKDYLHRFDWFADGKLLWVDAGNLYMSNADGQEKRTISVPEPVLEIWLDKTTGGRAFVSGTTALWRLDLTNNTWEEVQGLESLEQSGGSPISRIQANLRVSRDGTFGALLADHQVWKVPMTAEEPAQKIGEVEYLDEDWRVDAPIPLADSPYWYPGRDAYAPEAFDSPQASLVLIDERDGSLLSLADLVPPDFGYATGMQISPDEKWIAVLNVTSDHSPHSIYLASSNHLDNGKIIPVNSIRDWDITEVISSYPGRVNHPDFAFVITGDFGAHTAALNQLDLVSGKTQVIKKLGPGIYPIVRITWVQNTPIFIDGGVIERITENGILQPIGKLPELRLEDYPQLLIGGPVNQILFAAEVNKSVDNVCQTFYYLYIASLDNVK